ncbi:hypothetical protein PhaeoP97_04072 (plasmid) [Phaeobacter porticola]|uniref:Uncharacterized protein n=1 Tax=Phaeobacter porticola TaxID=1844006 RepID=A0A1L3IBF3_9RHOB|nr:hypothetical protein PhaeoP97_04072 [Phaeobacter porticola]
MRYWQVQVAICGDRAPQPVLTATDQDHRLVHVPLVVRRRSITANAISKVLTEVIYPQPNCFADDDHAPRSQQIFDVSCAQRKAMVSPNRVSVDLARTAKTLQAWHDRWDGH